MKLFYSKGACSLAVRILINELQLGCEYVAVDLKTKQTQSGLNFLTINSKGAVPTLALDSGDVLTENAVIHQYLADAHKAYHLLPALGDMKRYHILENLNYVTTELHKGFSPLFNSQVTQKEQIFIPAMMKKFQYVESRLAENDYFCGSQFTLPDGYLFVMLMWAQNAFKMDLSGMPHITRYYAQLLQRESIKKSLNEEK